jgi:hypothetical protein
MPTMTLESGLILTGSDQTLDLRESGEHSRDESVYEVEA